MLPAVLRIDAGSTSPFMDDLAPSPRTWEADDHFTGKSLPAPLNAYRGRCLQEVLTSCHGMVLRDAASSISPSHMSCSPVHACT